VPIDVRETDPAVEMRVPDPDAAVTVPKAGADAPAVPAGAVFKAIPDPLATADGALTDDARTLAAAFAASAATKA
jgi:hypothetical protein